MTIGAVLTQTRMKVERRLAVRNTVMIMKMDEKACRKCGVRGKRSCPALQGPICPACCGTGRVDPIPCPPECPYNPFGPGNYDQFLRVDETWQHKASDYVMARFGEIEFFKWVKRFSGVSAQSREWDMILAFHHLLFVHQEGAAVREWEERGAYELNHDERLLMRYRKGQVVTVMEVQKVLDDTAMRCVDLLDPERGPFMIFDRHTASIAFPYSRFLCGLAHFPHYSRMVCGGLSMDHDLTEPFLAAVHKNAASGGDPKAARIWISGHFDESMKLLMELGVERHERMIRSLDIHHCRGYYRLAAPRERVREAIQAKPEFLFDPDRKSPETPAGAESFIWLRTGEAAAYQTVQGAGVITDASFNGVPTLGNLFLTRDELIVEAFSRGKFEFAKGLLDRYFREVVAFERETDEDFSTRLRGGSKVFDDAQPTADEDGKTEEFYDDDEEEGLPAENRSVDMPYRLLEAFHAERYRKFIDEPIPMLSGKTPREASLDPAMRPRLVELMKLHINGMARDSREKGFTFDWVPTLSELGLNELM